MNISWLLGKFDKESGKVKFSIDRAAKSCHTPRRNDEIDAALRFYQSIYSWGDQVHRYFMNDLFPVQVDHGLDLSIIKDQVNLFELKIAFLRYFVTSFSGSLQSRSPPFRQDGEEGQIQG